MKQSFPDLICAFDMQGQEDTGHPLSYWVPDLLEMRAKITALRLGLPCAGSFDITVALVLNEVMIPEDFIANSLHILQHDAIKLVLRTVMTA
ncbi:hypothetical protein J3F83DRAFT_635824 [Trichoderma novae-zelandiae]